MRRAILVSTALATLQSFAGAAEKSGEDIVRRSREARANNIEAMAQGIVRVEAYLYETRENPQLGTGIVLSASPDKILILTALHVIREKKDSVEEQFVEAHSVEVTFYTKRPARYRANVLPRRSDSLDLALLQVSPKNNPELPTTFPAYHFLQNGEMQLGEQVYSVNGDWNLVPNTISRLSHEGDVQRFEYTNVSVGVGFSGGPVFDQYGNVIGMHDAMTTEISNLPRYAVAVKIDSALQTLEALGCAVPKAGPFSMPQLNAVGIPQSKPTAGSTTEQGSASSDAELYQKAMLSSDPAAMEAAAAKISNPRFATTLRTTAQMLRNAAQDRELSQQALLTRDPAAMEAAAAKISNPSIAAVLRTQAQMLRNVSQPAGRPDAAQIAGSRRRLQTQSMEVEAESYTRRGNYLKALPLYQQLAEGGDSESMASLGYFYYNGWAVDKDPVQAAKWFEKAAAAGETSVLATLGIMYASGNGVQRNDALAVEWDRKAAAAGDAIGMLGLGFMYENGRGVPRSLNMAADWYRKSANLGNATAKEKLRRLGLDH